MGEPNSKEVNKGTMAFLSLKGDRIKKESSNNTTSFFFDEATEEIKDEEVVRDKLTIEESRGFLTKTLHASRGPDVND